MFILISILYKKDRKKNKVNMIVNDEKCVDNLFWLRLRKISVFCNHDTFAVF